MPIFLIPAAAGAYIYFEKMRAKKEEEEQEQAEDSMNDQALRTSEDSLTTSSCSSPDVTTDDPNITPSYFESLQAAWKRDIDLLWSPVIEQKDVMSFKIDEQEYKMPKITFK
jgi:hypothetical protein